MVTFADGCLLKWLQDLTGYPYKSKTALGNMYDYFKVGNDEAESEDDATGSDTSADLLALIQADDQKHCYLTFTKEKEGEATALLLHHMARYPSRLGETSPFAGKWFITGGQPVGGVHITYNVPPELLGVSAPIQVYTAERIQRELANDIDTTTLVPEPTPDNVADIELISTRRAMWIPHQYASLCVEENLSPVEVFNRVYGALLQDGVTSECKPLVDFLRAQLHGHHATNTIIFVGDELTQPRSSPSLIHHRNEILSALASKTLPTTADAGVIKSSR